MLRALRQLINGDSPPNAIFWMIGTCLCRPAAGCGLSCVGDRPPAAVVKCAVTVTMSPDAIGYENSRISSLEKYLSPLSDTQKFR